MAWGSHLEPPPPSESPRSTPPNILPAPEPPPPLEPRVHEQQGHRKGERETSYANPPAYRPGMLGRVPQPDDSVGVENLDVEERPKVRRDDEADQYVLPEPFHSDQR